MPLIDSIRTINCDGPKCGKTITYDRRFERQTFDAPGNEWLKALRTVTTVDSRTFAYCSDGCEVEGAATGKHNLPQPKTIIDGVASAAQIEAAANAAKQAQLATDALKTGGPVTLG